MKTINDLKENQKITVYYKDGRIENCIYLGVSGNRKIMERYANNKGLTQAFGILVYSIDNPIYKDGVNLPILLFPETIEKIEDLKDSKEK